MKTTRALFLIATCLLTACSAEQDSTSRTAAVDDTPQPAPAPVPASAETAPDFGNTPSIRTLMNTQVQPNADTLWKAVRYVVNADGVAEDVAPETDADWTRLADSAFALVAAGDALLAPDLHADPAPPDGDYKYTGPEIQALLDANRDPWRYYVEQMLFATNRTLETILARDVLGLLETSAAINNACNGCHAEYWYRPNR